MGNVGASLELRGIGKSYGIGKERLVRAADGRPVSRPAPLLVLLRSRRTPVTGDPALAPAHTA